MAILTTDIKIRLSTTAGTAGNQNTQANPNLSLGKYISTTDWAGGTVHDLFDVITGPVNEAMTPDYRCLCVYNAHGSLTYEGVTIWLSAETAGGANISIGLDTTAHSAVAASAAQALLVANETTAPAGVTFSSPTSYGAGILLGNLPAGRCRAIWLKRLPLNTGPLDADSVTLSFQGDSAA